MQVPCSLLNKEGDDSDVYLLIKLVKSVEDELLELANEEATSLLSLEKYPCDEATLIKEKNSFKCILSPSAKDQELCDFDLQYQLNGLKEHEHFALQITLPNYHTLLHHNNYQVLEGNHSVF